MSYILDALKKSEQERGHGNIPSVQTIHSSSLNYRNEKKVYWPYILITAVILNLLAIVYFITDKDKTSVTKTEEIQNNAVASKTIKHDFQQASAIDNTQATALKHVEKQQDITAPISKSSVQQEESRAHNTVTNTSTGSTFTTTTPTENNYKNTAEHTNLENDNTGVIEFHELPESTKQQLPAIIVSAHVYSSNPMQRSIVINNDFMEEGEYVLDDLILYEITADGAIFYYRDIIFHYGVVSSWQ
jgi:hypothetical protein